MGLVDLSVSWDQDWAVVLEASWGISMTVLVGGSFLAVAVRPQRARPAWATLGVTLVSWLVAAAFPGEWAGFSPTWSWLCLAWAAAVVLLALLPGRAPHRSEPRELGLQVVEAE